MRDCLQGTPVPPTSPSIQALLSTVFREEVGRLVGALLRILGNFAVAEEIAQEALLVALERWPHEGIPECPGAWLMTIARRLAPAPCRGACFKFNV
jgi:predicted RNA polymerase sigma factor